MSASSTASSLLALAIAGLRDEGEWDILVDPRFKRAFSVQELCDGFCSSDFIKILSK